MKSELCQCGCGSQADGAKGYARLCYMRLWREKNRNKGDHAKYERERRQAHSPCLCLASQVRGRKSIFVCMDIAGAQYEIQLPVETPCADIKQRCGEEHNTQIVDIIAQK